MTQVRTKLGKVGFSPRGLWKVGTAYERLDVVTFFGSSFVSLSENNTEPLTDETKWMPIAKKGDKGDAFIYEDFTPEQLAKLKGDKGDPFLFNDFTPEQIENLKQPATEAAQVALGAASEALNVPKIQDGYFWLYSVEQKKYIKSNSKATGRSPQARDGIWWEYNDEIGDYVSTNISASSDYELTKPKIETVLTGDVTSHNHATQLAEALANYVQVVAGKQLSTEDFTTAFKNKLTGLENYNDAAVVASIAAVNGRLDTLTGTSASEAIDTFREIEAFLQGITDTKTLTGLLSDLKAEIVTLIPTKLSQLQNDDNTVKDASYQHTDNNYTAADKAKLAKINLVPTLDHEPGENDLSFSDSDGEHTFTVGNQARVLDADSGEYVFWQLYDITVGNKAVWKRTGSGGDLELTEKVVITLASNQAQPDNVLIGTTIQVTGTDGTEYFTGTWQGAEIKVKVTALKEYNITVGDIEGYATPAVTTYTSELQGERSVTLNYNTCVLTVAITGLEEGEQATTTVSYADKQITLNSGESVKVPFDAEITVSGSSVAGYTTPEPQTFTAAQVSRSIDMAYVYNPIVYSYITINQNITDPATMISGDINGEAIQAVRQNSHRVVGKYTGPKQMTYCRLMDDDGTKYHDGTTYTPQNGADVFMMLPEFYTKATETSTDVWQIGFAFGGQPDATWKKWGGNDLIGVYKAYIIGKLFSRTQVTPTVSTSQANFKTYARNRGDGYTIVKHKHQNIMAFLFYAMYGNTNAQAICGSGTSSYPKQTGQTNLLGMEDTVNGGNGSSGSINFWGLENWWGDIYEWEDNVVVDNRVWKVTEDDGTVRTCPQAYTSDGYISKIQVSEHLDTICKAIGGSDITGYCDYYSRSSNSARVVARSYGGAYSYGGVADAYANYDASYTVSYIGSRLAFMGDLVEAESVAAFAAIPVTNA